MKSVVLGVCKKEISTNYDVVGGGGGAEKVDDKEMLSL